MKQKIIMRSLMGIPIGVFISTVFSIVFSGIFAQGRYGAVTPVLVERMGNEWNAVVVQFLASCILGAVFAGASCIWEIENWSLLKQTAVHLCVLGITMFPLAWLLGWMPQNPGGVGMYVGIFAAIYLVLFLAIYSYWKKRIKQMNDKLTGKNHG